MELGEKITISGCAVLFSSIFFGFWGFDAILTFGIKDQTALRKRNEIFDIYRKLPFALEFKVFLFNISNPEEVMQGAKPKLTQVGPYWYNLWKEKINIDINKSEDSLTYTQYDVYQFNKVKSGKLSENDYVTMLDPLLIGTLNTVEEVGESVLQVANKALPYIFNNPKTVYRKLKVKDILFEGIDVWCNSTTFAVKAVCLHYKQKTPGTVFNENGYYKFSLLGPRNATPGARFKVLRGIHNYKDLGRLIEFNGQTSSSLWGTKYCNQFNGTDGWIFPPFLEKEEGIWTYSTDLCRSIQAYFVEDTEFKGVNVRRYHVDYGDQSSREDEKCYCLRTCMKKGVFDLGSCLTVPIYGSLPHFLMGDETLTSDVEGLDPRVTDHITFIHFEPLTGTPIEARLRLQLNMPIKPWTYIDLTKNMSTFLHPVLWIEQGMELDGKLLRKVKNIFLLINVVNITKYIGILGGTVAAIIGTYMHFKNEQVVIISKGQNKVTEEPLQNSNIPIQYKQKPAIFTRKVNTSINHVMSGNELNKYNLNGNL